MIVAKKSFIDYIKLKNDGFILILINSCVMSFQTESILPISARNSILTLHIDHSVQYSKFRTNQL